MKRLRLALMMIFLICDVPSQSNASFLEIARKFTQDSQKSNPSNQLPPAPSPVPETKMNSGNTQNPVKSPNTETCDKVSNKCDIKEYNFTACVPLVGNGFQAMYVIVLNDYKSSLKVNITAFPANNTLDNIVIPEHDIKKVNLSSNTEGYASFLLNVENGNCTIHLGASVSEGFYTNYLTPINGAFLLFVTALFIGGTCIWFKLGKRGRHLDGVKYRELEMEQQESTPPLKIQMPDDWDQDWDGEWDDEKEWDNQAQNM